MKQRPQDLKFTKEQLNKAFGPIGKVTRKQYLKSLRKQYEGKRYQD